MKKYIIFILVLCPVVWIANTASGAIIVGRITHVEGKIYRFMDVDQSWVETFAESPAGTQDLLTTGEQSRAEITFPNNMLVRLDEQVDIEILEMAEDAGIFALQAGLARFYNRNTAGSLAVETSMGTVTVEPGSAVDVQVNKNSLVVSAVQGEATFQSAIDSAKLEVISGSTSLEFHEDSIIAGTGPIDRNWDSWCAARGNIWTQNRVVHSEYLPESMQEYAYALEPYGSWHRIYYRGYYYLAWRPRHVAAGWAPYTSGFWHDWQDGPVWIDHNPWGWVTHHHGHWIHLQGAWMWTPYVHVSYVPGVAVAGFTITFGKAFRPYWHPGRVRWLAHSSHIGWLPLAPWETYYGHRRWGPRSVAVHGGANFNISINLKNHRYVDHAVIIPRQHFHQKGPGIINYNTVKIKNINKTVIANNYKPLPLMAKEKKRKHGTKATRADSAEKRIVKQAERRKPPKRVSGPAGRDTRRKTVKQVQKKEKPERTVFRSKRTSAQKATAIKRNKQITRADKAQKRDARPGQKSAVEKIEYQEKTAQESVTAAVSKPRRPITVEAKNRRIRKPRQAVNQTSRKDFTERGNKTVAVKQNNSGIRKQAQQKKHVLLRQVKQNKERRKRAEQETGRHYPEKERPDEFRQEKQIAGVPHYNPQQNTSRKRHGERQRTGRDFVSASNNNMRFR
jgi:hypothetical protein